ncbi:MAG: PQQ-binding-like beta-propeller repeat protein, partial [Phycisphaeraceae bacterium]|nr:PQQ-binding-like beta-propeller repeat protein [Phycisphaeraceae bacterium]
MRKIIKIGLKIILGLVGALVLGVGILVMLNWDSVQILTGTGDLSNPSQDIPTVFDTPVILRQTGESDWPCWRGANGDATSTVTGIIKDWSQGLNQLWQVDYLCQGPASATWASPVICGDRLIVCGRDEGKDLVFCLNANTGDLLWQNHHVTAAGNSHGTGMRATPAIDEDRVYTFGRSGDLVCWALSTGEMLWQKNVQDQGGKAPKWGHSSSPHVTDKHVLVQGGGTARVIAYDKLSGEVTWTSG